MRLQTHLELILFRQSEPYIRVNHVIPLGFGMARHDSRVRSSPRDWLYGKISRKPQQQTCEINFALLLQLIRLFRRFERTR